MSFNSNLIGKPHYVARALNALIDKGETYTMQGDDYSTMDWDVNNTQTMPTETEVATKAEELRAVDAYAAPRSRAYPPIGDQLDDLYRAGAFSADMASAIEAIKLKFPKP